jgi:cyclic di-GMP phosphodiesterase
MDNEGTPRSNVDLSDLTSQMTIIAYTGFHDKYKSIDKKTGDWIKHNFKGTTIKIGRNGKGLELPVSELLEGDTLLQVHKFPQALEKLVRVSDPLTKELQKRGFLKFEVIQPKKRTPAQLEKRKQSVNKAEDLIQKVKESVEVRDKASQAVEDLMDSSRNGDTSTSEILGFVDSIVTSSSADAITAISSLKESDQTYAHCIDVGAIFQVVYLKTVEKLKVKNVFKDEQEILLSSFLHDFGKAKVPKEILDSTVRFERDSKEMQLMQGHPVFGAEMLTAMNMPRHIVDMAHYHHVKLDTTMASSYPDGVIFEDISLEARMIAIIDIYQALVGKRSYKKSWAPPAAIRFIDSLAGVEYDLDIWNEFMQIMGKYPKGSAVELSEGSQGFVINVPETDLNRPQVVVVRNAQGEDLEHHELVDLEVDQDIKIVKELDSYETFGDNVIEFFTSLQVI